MADDDDLEDNIVEDDMIDDAAPTDETEVETGLLDDVEPGDEIADEVAEDTLPKPIVEPSTDDESESFDDEATETEDAKVDAL